LINGNQNIAGNKNFTSSINVPTPINANDAVNKSFVTLHVSTAGDSLFLGNNQYVIIPGISLANPFRYPVNDMDGNGYDTIRIGTQVWLGENLKTTKYNDGTLIPLVTADSSWINLSTPAYCWCNNDSITYKNPYGAFYNWYTINTGKICPIGWHIPSNSDWAFLFSYLGSNAGGKMKEAGTQHWKSPNAGANNSSKFNALPAGGRVNGGSFVYIGYDVGYWSSDNDPGNTAVTRNWDYNNTFVGYFNGYKFYGFPVRCLKN
jgi:uncharacterized protein (TIGR02145 family)